MPSSTSTFTPLDKDFIPSLLISSLVALPAIEATPSTSIAARPAIIATTSDENLGEVKIADEVVAIIAALAATEVEGVASMAGNITNELIGKLGMKNLSKGVKVDVLEGIVTVSLALNLKYNYSIVEVSARVQEKVKNAIENMTGLEVADVNIKVAGVEMESQE